MAGGDPSYARDYTRLMRHRGKMPRFDDWSLAWMPGGGLDLSAAGWALGAGIGVGGLAALFSMLIGATVAFLVGVVVLFIVFAVVYFVLSHDTDGRDSTWQRYSMAILGWSQPESIDELRKETEPTDFALEAIVQRKEGQPGIAKPVRQFQSYGYSGDRPISPLQSLEWPAADESFGQWRDRRGVAIAFSRGREVIFGDDEIVKD